MRAAINNKLFSEQTNNKKCIYFYTFVYTHTEPREHQKAVLPRYVVPHNNQAS